MVTLVRTNGYAAAIEAAATRAADKEKEFVLFADDKATVALESAILKKVSGYAAFHATVTSFTRFFARRKPSLTALSKEGSSMVIRRILAERKGEFRLFPPVGGKKNLAASLYEMIAQLKSACVSPEDLLSAAEKESGLLKAKLVDLAALYRRYEAYLAEKNTTDQGGYLSALPAYLRASGVLAEKEVFLVGYTSLTEQMKRIVTALLSSGARVTGFFAAGGYAADDQAITAFLQAVKAAGEEPREEEFSLPSSETAEFLRKNWYSPQNYAGKVQKECTGVGVFAAATQEDEVERVAKTLLRRVREGARFRDFTVVCSDVAAYGGALSAVFSKYEIPYFADEKRTLASHPLFGFVTAFLSLGLFGLTETTVLPFTSNPYFPAAAGDPEAFAAYVRRYGVKYNRFFQPFTLPYVALEGAEKCRAALESLYRSPEKRATGAEYVAAVQSLLRACGVAEKNAELTQKLQGIAPEYADFTRQAPAHMERLLSETLSVLGDASLSLEEFYDVLTSGAAADEMSALPSLLDAVLVAEPSKAQVELRPYVFALGMNASVPSVTQDTAFLSDRDLLSLEGKGVSVDPKISEINDRARAETVAALTSFTKTLVLSYALTDGKGTAQRESEMITLLKKMVLVKGRPPETVTEADLSALAKTLPEERRAAREADAYATPAAAKERFFAETSDYSEGGAGDLFAESGYYAYVKAQDAATGKREAEVLSSAIKKASGLRGETPVPDYLPRSISVSVLESYFSCPYKNYLKNALRLEEPKTAEIESNDSGLILHEVLEHFGRVMMEREVEEGEISALAEGLFHAAAEKEEYAQKRISARSEAAFSRLKQEAVRACRTVWAHFRHSDFRITAVEQKIGFDGEVPPLRLSAGKKRVPLTGKIDRVDESDTHFRIVDYKSGSANVADKNLYEGKKIQLPLYLAAVAKAKGKPAAGAYYFPVRDRYESEPAPARLIGKSLLDEEVLVSQDRTLAHPKAPIAGEVLDLTVKPGKEGEIVFQKGGVNLLSPAHFDAQQTYAEALAEGALSEMAEGYILPTPRDGVCAYCKFSALCGRETALFGSGRTVGSVNADTLLLAVEKMQNKTQKTDTAEPAVSKIKELSTDPTTTDEKEGKGI